MSFYCQQGSGMYSVVYSMSTWASEHPVKKQDVLPKPLVADRKIQKQRRKMGNIVLMQNCAFSVHVEQCYFRD